MGIGTAGMDGRKHGELSQRIQISRMKGSIRGTKMKLYAMQKESSGVSKSGSFFQGQVHGFEYASNRELKEATSAGHSIPTRRIHMTRR